MVSTWFINGVAVTSTVVDDRPNPQIAIHRRGAVGVHQNLGVRFGVEPFFCNCEFVASGGKIGYQIRTVGLRVCYDFEVGCDVDRFYRGVRHRRAG